MQRDKVAVNLEKGVSEEMTLGHVIRRATMATRKLDNEARAKADKEKAELAEKAAKAALFEKGDTKRAPPPPLPREHAAPDFMLAPQVKMVDGRLQVDTSSLYVQVSASFLAELSVSSPQKLFIFII